MCGIAGYIGKENFNNKKVTRILNLMDRRGPDSKGFKKITLEQKQINFFFSRLSIIDKRKISDQPFKYKESLLIFNGEIYNYIELRSQLKKLGYNFTTNSDTEVLIKALHCWGEAAINKLEGMWSFFYFDKLTSKGLLCRDRFGEKPLFYFQENNEIVFGSEIKFIEGIAEKKFQLNFNKIEDFLRFGYKSLNKDNQSYFNNIHSVPPGHLIRIKNNKLEIKKYWKLAYKPTAHLEEKEIYKKIKEKLLKSIEIRLRADFPIAFLLSGGLDSNALAFLAKKYFNYDVNTFSIISKDPKYDESKVINYSIKKLKVKHQNFKINFNKCNFIENLKEQIRYHDSPVTTINSFLSFMLLKKIKKEGFKVCISGIGSDEIFSGYYDHHLLYLYEMKNNKELYAKSLNNWKKNTLPFVKNPYLKKYNLYNNNPKFREHIFQNDKFKDNMFYHKKKPNFKEKIYVDSLMKNRMINEMKHEIVPVLLKEDDLNSMYNSIENRSPFLDTELFSECLNMPSKYYVKDGLAKWPLRKIINNIVPDKIRLNRRKIGFNAPIEEVIDLNNKKNIDFLISDSEIFKIVKKDKILRLINKKKNFTGVENNFIFSFLSSKIFIDNHNK